MSDDRKNIEELDPSDPPPNSRKSDPPPNTEAGIVSSGEESPSDPPPNT